MTEDGMVRWHHRLNGHEFEQVPGDGEGQGSLACCCPWDSPWTCSLVQTTENEMVRWHHRLNGHEFEQTLGDSEGQGSLVCCSPWGHIELDTTK